MTSGERAAYLRGLRDAIEASCWYCRCEFRGHIATLVVHGTHFDATLTTNGFLPCKCNAAGARDLYERERAK